MRTFEPRKTPVQKRSTLTLEAIAEATIQVLLALGRDRLTTTRVAERAGVSVGTLYQYYPNKWERDSLAALRMGGRGFKAYYRKCGARIRADPNTA